MTLKQLLEQRAAHVAKMRAFNDANPNMTAEQDAQWNAMNDDYDKIEAAIQRESTLEKQEAAINAHRPVPVEDVDGAPSGEQSKAEEKKIEQAFRQYMFGGLNSLSQEERIILNQRRVVSNQRIINADPKMALTTATGAGGEFLVPTGFSDKLEIAEKYYGGIIDVATIFTTAGGNPIPYPMMNDTGQMASLLGVNTAATEADPAFTNVIFNAYKFTSNIVQVPMELIEDSYFDIATLLANAFGERFGRAYNYYCTVGTGSSQPTGVATVTPVGLTLATGNTTTLTFDNFFDLEYSVDLAYRSKGTFMLNDQSVRLIRKLKDNYGQYLWQNAAGPTPAMIGGRPFITNNSVPVPAASAVSVLFGDFSKFMIRKVAGYTLLRLDERYAEYGQVAFIAFARWDSNLLDAGTHPIQGLQQSAT